MKKIMARLTGPIAFLLFAALISCVVNPVTGEKEFNIVSEAMEIQMGQETDVSIRAEYGIYDDRTLNAYVEAVGRRMVPITHRPNLPYHFAVLDTPVENAFAAPGGYIYITRGMLAIINDEAALAAIIGHELGHVNARHTARAMSRQILLMGGLLVVGALSEDIAKITPFAMIGLQVLSLKFSRDDEYQADSLGIQYSRAAGWAPGQVVPLFTTFLRLEQSGGGPSLPNFLSTHPLTSRRIEEINKMLLPADPGRRVARNDYLGRVDGLVYGNNPRQGYVESGAFYHPDLQFMIIIPKGWKYQNTPKRFVMVPQDEKAAVFLTTEASAKDLSEFMKDKLASYKESQVQELSRGALRINGLSAFRGLYDIRPKVRQGQQNQADQGTPMTVDIRCIRKGGQIFTFLSTTASSSFKGYEPAIDGAIRSFQALSDADKLNRRAWRVGLQSGRRGETLKAILLRLKVDQKLWKAHELMNGMLADSALDADRMIKFLH
ncbi:MAG: M48 family metalloprotease [Candidatus Aminicenantales bacterium]|jgi:predicted Zn-dependent protease